MTININIADANKTAETKKVNTVIKMVKTTYNRLNRIAYKNGCPAYDMFEEIEDGDEVRQGATLYQTEDGTYFTEM